MRAGPDSLKGCSRETTSDAFPRLDAHRFNIFLPSKLVLAESFATGEYVKRRSHVHPFVVHRSG